MSNLRVLEAFSTQHKKNIKDVIMIENGTSHEHKLNEMPILGITQNAVNTKMDDKRCFLPLASPTIKIYS
jgi:hypothetical protein